MIGHPAVTMQETPKPKPILHVGRCIEPEIAAQRGDLRIGRHPRPCALEQDLRWIARRELGKDKGEQADAEEHGQRTEKPPCNVSLQCIHRHFTSRRDTP